MHESTKHVTEANEFFNALQAFALAHPFWTAIVASILLSWVLTLMFKKPIRFIGPDAWDAWNVRFFDFLVAGVAAFFLLRLLEIPLAWCVVCALGVGGLSPVAYAIFAGAICWKWPGARKYLSLGELLPEPVSDETGDDLPPRP